MAFGLILKELLGSGIIGKALDLIPDPDKRTEVRTELEAKVIELEQKALDIELEGIKGQNLANIEQAKHPNWFVAGARPGAMWAATLSFAYLVGRYIGADLSTILGHPVTLPEMPPEIVELVRFVLLGTLGLWGGMRTLERVKGVSREYMRDPKPRKEKGGK